MNALDPSFMIFAEPPVHGRLGRSVARLFLALAWLVPTCIWAAESIEPVDFDRDVRPILSDKCFTCHGPDAEARQAELRLDTRAGATEYVVVAGNPEDSELVMRIFAEEDDYRMPPPVSNLSLSSEQKKLLRRWIAEGAEYTEHWSFRPLPARVAVPPAGDAAWPRETLDRFVLARLEVAGLRPSPEAEPLRLLRRVTLDLTGLPPTPAEVRAFEEAARVDRDAALELAVDRLLASPAFGEQMAIAWLDAARYGDSYGYQSDQLNTQWPYRDWVVRALNDNLPFDQFIIWQLAGDLLENPTPDQVLATAYNRMHRLTNEGGSLAEEWLVENASDRVHTFGTSMLGLTLECSRCHDHKYDPITQRDYYSLSAFFNSIDENGLYDRSNKVPSPSLLLPTEEQAAGLAAAREAVAGAERALKKAVIEGQERCEAWVAKNQNQNRLGEEDSPIFPRGLGKIGTVPDGSDLIGYFSFDDASDEIPNQVPGAKSHAAAKGIERVAGVRGQAVRFDGDRGVVFPDFFEVDRWDEFTVDFWIRAAARNPLPVVVLQRTYGTDVGYNGFDVVLADGFVEMRMYRVWPGNGIGVRATEPIAQDAWQHLTVAYDGSSTAAGLRLYFDGKEVPTTVLRDRIHKKAAVEAHGEGQLTLGERFRDRGFKDGQLDEFRVFDRALAPLEIRDLHDGRALATAFSAADEHRDELREYYFSAIDPDARRHSAELRDARRRFVEAEEPIQEVAVMEELPEPRAAHILVRGAYDAPKTDENRVGRDTFEQILIPFSEDAPRDRLGLAQWMTAPNHPLTARVAVNRLWANFFGRGLVRTPENFGRQGAAPTHPELLDWLARDFVDHGWDVKRLCRAIVLSATYRQDSRLRPELRALDPENELLARGPSRRLSAEQIRDLALAASGLMVPKMGGPPVSPYQPGEDLWREANEMSPPYQQSTGKGLYRRSLYSVWKRTAPLPNMLAFDAVTREVCTVSRSRTNTPLQALVLLNDVQFVEAARAVAEQVARELPDAESQIAEAFLRLTGREPDAREAELLREVYNEQRALFAESDEQDASSFIHLGESAPDGELPPADLAALTATCQVILNLDATIYER